jgi:CheY-like chemotaxis protein
LLQRQLQGSGEAASFAGSAALQALTAAAEPRSVELSIDMPLGQTLQVQATQALHEAQAGTHAAQGAPWRLALTATGAEAERLVRQVPQLESRLRARGLLEGSVDLVAREGRQERGEGGEHEA